MSSTTSSTYYKNIDRIRPLTIEEFNKLLEDNKPYTKETFKAITPSNIESLEGLPLDYNIDLRLLICSECSTTLTRDIPNIIKHLKVSIVYRVY